MDEPYDVFSFHNTVPVVIHENQRSSTVFGGLSSLRGPPKYSANNPLKGDIRGPWSLHPSGKPTTKEEVQLPSSTSKSLKWGWMTDWFIDMNYPRIDSQGWQYSKSFDDSDKSDRLWSESPIPSSGGGVRRRRWVRVMKRIMEFSNDSSNGEFLQLVNESDDDYLTRAEAIIKRDQENGKGKDLSVTDQLSKYREAIEILQNGIKSEFQLLIVLIVAINNGFMDNPCYSYVAMYNR